VQDAAHGNLLRSTRQQLHAQIARRARGHVHDTFTTHRVEPGNAMFDGSASAMLRLISS
jgi:hypothetical protein